MPDQEEEVTNSEDTISHLDVLKYNGVYFFVHDIELRNEIANGENETISGIEQLLNNLIESLATVAYSGRYDDLIDAPSIGGAEVEGETLVFSGSSSTDITPQELEELDRLIGDGDI